MTSALLHSILHNYSYLQVYGLTLAYFLVLYFLIGSLFLLVCKQLEKRKVIQPITATAAPYKNIGYEIKNSVRSIFIFGFSGIPLIYGFRTGFIALLPDTLWTALFGLVLLMVWNEIHFFLIHRLMHVSWFYKYIHVVHHRSKIPTVFSVFSFHWVEALLLSTVEFTIAVFIPFSAVALFLYPLVSILLNFAGHCNYRFGNGQGAAWKLVSTRHAAHHSINKREYGFASYALDKLFSFQKKNK
ncbi:MAG: Fatty acid hydroxylase family protein [Cytophagaceae bacterium]|jgi:sterol desaturase/sphingolipid hydroxylase (fatty acid hydroxylase superfamily)|nr:Fatty acid hydroxylase family protein [Cytophagaceae bacterium]